ncbi:hypothetical protein FKV24_000910 [Lysobacter maris]|uniref:Uncharacterized protein n=1 Tax=Marilutibacter maris TaxID=1605891 RepID=A0A508B7F3_9GAMM|nr:hypothetical protein FKV24_000910 [Lysobacter maris]
MTAIRMVGFDADDTLWRSEDYFHGAQQEFERIVAHYVDLDDVGDRLYAIEKNNIALFGYGVKGMALSMVEAAVEITDARISARDLHRIVGIAKELLAHPVELLPGVREAIEAVAADFEIVLITKGDLFHQERKAPPRRRRANTLKRLISMSLALRGRRGKGRSCSPMGPDVSQNCLGFATVSGAA